MRTRPNSNPDRLRAFVARPHEHLWRAGVALALAVPHAAYPYSLEQLLSLPLERLLQLQISPRRAAHAGAGDQGGAESVSQWAPHAA